MRFFSGASAFVLALCTISSYAAPVPDHSNIAASNSTSVSPRMMAMFGLAAPAFPYHTCPTVDQIIQILKIPQLHNNALFWTSDVALPTVQQFAEAHGKKTLRDILWPEHLTRIRELCDPIHRIPDDGFGRMSAAMATIASGEAWVLNKPQYPETGAVWAHHDPYWDIEFATIKRVRRVTQLFRVNLDPQNRAAPKHLIWPTPGRY